MEWPSAVPTPPMADLSPGRFVLMSVSPGFTPPPIVRMTDIDAAMARVEFVRNGAPSEEIIRETINPDMNDDSDSDYADASVLLATKTPLRPHKGRAAKDAQEWPYKTSAPAKAKALSASRKRERDAANEASKKSCKAAAATP